MNRPIEFRAKRADTKEWVFGNLFVPNQLVKGVYICPKTTCVDFAPGMDESFPEFTFEKASSLGCALGHFIEVIPETVGQFTGLLDRNGKKIFEGDFITIGNSDFGLIQTKGGNPILYEVKTEGCDYTLYRNDIQLNWGRLSRVEEIGFTIFSVIGTIHDKL